MKTIGLIGGMSWESSIEYYRLINEGVKARLGGLHSANCLVYSVDFADIEPLQRQGRWQEAAQRMVEAACRVQDGGAAFLVLCTNTMHKTADDVQKHLRIPLLHIVDATAAAIKRLSLKKIALLGTRFTMEDEFYRGRLATAHGLDVITPDGDQRQIVHDVIYNELCVGRIVQQSKRAYIEIIEDLIQRGAEGIILGCTEIPLLIGQEDCAAPVFDTTRIHAEAAVDYALA